MVTGKQALWKLIILTREFSAGGEDGFHTRVD